MRRKRKSLPPDTPVALVPEEILDQFVRQGPISPEELDAAVRRFKKAIIERARKRADPTSVTRQAVRNRHDESSQRHGQ
jgi:hypothetical protein